MIAADDYPLLLRQYEKRKRELDKITGAVDQLLEELRDRFKVKSLKEAKKLYARYQGEEEEEKLRYRSAKKRFESEFKKVIEDES